MFWWGYLFSQDETFLRDKAYPVMKEYAEFLEGWLEKDDRGVYNVPAPCMSNSETAEILEITVSSLKSRLHRDRMLLRKHLSDYVVTKEN